VRRERRSLCSYNVDAPVPSPFCGRSDICQQKTWSSLSAQFGRQCSRCFTTMFMLSPPPHGNSLSRPFSRGPRMAVRRERWSFCQIDIGRSVPSPFCGRCKFCFKQRTDCPQYWQTS